MLGMKHTNLSLKKHVLGPAQEAQQHEAELSTLYFS